MSSSRRNAFTLIELLITTTLLVMIIAVVLVNVEGMVPSIRIEGAAREIGATVADVQSSAAVTGKTHGIVYDLTGSRFWILAPPEEAEDDSYSDLLPSEDEAKTKLELAAEDLQALEPTELHSGVHIKDVQLGGERKKSRGRVTLLFDPGGEGTPHSVHLEDKEGNEFTVEINPFSGTVEYYEGYREFDVFIEDK